MESGKAASRPVVLVVEDDHFILMDACEIIEQAGFATVAVPNADRAMAELEGRDDIRALFTDIEMPGSLNGLQLATAVHKRWPGIAILVASGRHRIGADELPEQASFFSKPYQAVDIQNTLRSLIG